MNTCRNLTTLAIGATNISRAIPSSLWRCQKLNILGLGGNQLNGTVSRSLEEVHQLQFLQLNRNGALTGEDWVQVYDIKFTILISHEGESNRVV